MSLTLLRPRWLALLVFACFPAAWADIDPDTFPADIRALEWREIGPYRGGRSAAVTALPPSRHQLSES